MTNNKKLPHRFWRLQHFLSIGLLMLSLAACSASDKAANAGPTPGGAPPPLPVNVMEAQPTQIPAALEAIGQTQGAKEVEVRARVSGILDKKLYQEGAPVKEGQVLFQIDRSSFEIALAQAKAQRAEQRAKLTQTARDVERLKKLLAQQAISQREYDDATTSSSVAQATLQAADANVRQAELNLSYTAVTAPISGVSGRSEHSEGALITTGADSLLTTISEVNPIWVRFSLSENELAQLPGGHVTPNNVKELELILPDGSIYPTKGRLNFSASEIDTKLGTLQLRAEFDNPQMRVLPGQFVRVRVITGQRDGVFLIPQTAVMQSDLGRFIYVVGANNTAEIRPIKTGEWHGKDWVILEGLKSGDKVILDNLLKLRPGAPVKAQTAAEKSAPPPAGGKT
ncbi:MAG: efflux RND transporter periplasmic adaptor subunit [Gammaproteobacteria bacterium]|nr:efflux RND transporter periplasmic adaptor subunit [Gammaproteobacteria bacterium]